MEIRKAKFEDLLPIKSSFIYSKNFGISIFNSDYIYVCTENDIVIGYLYGNITKNEDMAILIGLEVLEKYRNKKIATKLIEQFKNDLKKTNCTSIVVHYNNKENLNQFYEKNGFDEMKNISTSIKVI